MSVLVELYIVIFLIYLFECIILVEENTAILYSSWFSFKISYKEGIYKWTNKFVKFLNPFLPQMDVFRSDFQSYSLSPEGISSIRANDLRNPNNLSTKKTFYKYDEIIKIRLMDNVIHINDDMTINCNSSYEAEQTEKLLTEILSLQSENTEQKIDEFLANTFRLRDLKDKLNTYEERTFILKNIVLVYCLFLLLIIPVLLFNLGFYLVFEKIIFIIAGLHVVTIGILILTYRSLYGKVYSSDFKSSLIKTILSPLSACRSITIVSEQYLRQFHPIVIMKHLLPEKLFKVWGNKIIREYRYLNEFKSVSEVEQRILIWYSEKVNTLINRFMIDHEYNIEEFLKPKFTMSINTLSYCPRCLTEYSIENGQCSDCEGINLIKLEETGQLHE